MSDEPSPEIGADERTGRGSDAERGSNPDDHTTADDGRRGLSDRAAFWTSLVLALAVSVGSVWLVGVRAVHFEALNRVRPTVEGGGVGSGWIEGNTEPALEWLITLVHFADVIMGVFILVMVFIHWIAFRRLAARMRPPDAPREAPDAVATDGGEPSGASRFSSKPRSDDASAANGGDAE